MHVSLLQENLVKALLELKKAIPARPQLPILGSILMIADKQGVQLAATDLYLGIKTLVRGVVDTPGIFAVPAKTFVDFIQTLGPGTLTLTVTDGKLTVKSDKTKTILQGFPGEDYPPFPEKEGDSFTLPKESLEKITDLIIPAAAKDDARPVLTAVLFSPADQGGTDIVSTDGFRLAKMWLDFTLPETSLLFPVGALQEVVRLMQKQNQSEVTLTISQKLKQVFCEVGDVEMVIRLLEGAFPPYQKVIPSQCKQTAVLDGAELESHVKSALVLARDAGNIIKLGFAGEKITISTTSPTAGEHQSVFTLLKNVAEPIEVAFNGQYVVDFLRAIKAKTLKIGLNEPLQPVLFQVDDVPEYSHVIMPFRVAA